MGIIWTRQSSTVEEASDLKTLITVWKEKAKELPTTGCSIDDLIRALQSCKAKNFELRYKPGPVTKINDEDFQTGVLTVSYENYPPIEFARGLGECDKKARHDTYRNALMALKTLDVDSLMSLGDSLDTTLDPGLPKDTDNSQITLGGLNTGSVNPVCQTSITSSLVPNAAITSSLLSIAAITSSDLSNATRIPSFGEAPDFCSHCGNRFVQSVRRPSRKRRADGSLVPQDDACQYCSFCGWQIVMKVNVQSPTPST